MKLLRYGDIGNEKPGLLDVSGQIRDLSGIIRDITPATLSPVALQKIALADPLSLPLVDGKPRIGPCVSGVPKLVGVGLNYSDHAKETGAKTPKEPVLFLKAVSAISGPNDDIVIPQASHKTDHEVELAVVIGTKASYVSVQNAPIYIAGYCVANDVSEREFQMERGGNWSKGKSADSFAPIGPYLVTAEEVPHPQALHLFCEVNGVRVQDSNTSEMIFPVYELVSYISQFMTLMPGDIILTGTPAGVGMGAVPPRFLKPGDVVRVSIAGLGSQEQNVVTYIPALHV